ncbi:MAG: acylphosphatase [Nanoarchaeota archaeon]|nr:acylphosphatase [Nanoarchaeota archaeon]
MKTLRVYISGTVQGVLFKKYLEEEGNKLRVRGYIRETSNGRMEVVIEGLNDKVDKMLEICRVGTKHAQIRNVEVNEIKYQGFEGFKITKL